MNINIIITHKNGRKQNLVITETDTVEKILEKFYNSINHTGTRYYLRDKVIFKLGDVLLNENQDSLKQTANELQIEDNDMFTWLETETINAGKFVNFL